MNIEKGYYKYTNKKEFDWLMHRIKRDGLRGNNFLLPKDEVYDPTKNICGIFLFSYVLTDEKVRNLGVTKLINVSDLMKGKRMSDLK